MVARLLVTVAGMLVNGCWVVIQWLLGCQSMVAGLLVNSCRVVIHIQLSQNDMTFPYAKFQPSHMYRTRVMLKSKFDL